MLPHNVGLVYFHIIYALKFLEKKNVYPKGIM